MSEPCPHERGDHDYPAAIGSFVAQTRALTAMTAERDAARAALARVAELVHELPHSNWCPAYWNLADHCECVIGEFAKALEPTDQPKGKKP